MPLKVSNIPDPPTCVASPFVREHASLGDVTTPQTHEATKQSDKVRYDYLSQGFKQHVFVAKRVSQ